MKYISQTPVLEGKVESDSYMLVIYYNFLHAGWNASFLEFQNPRVLCSPEHTCSTSYMKNIVCLDNQGNMGIVQTCMSRFQSFIQSFSTL